MGKVIQVWKYYKVEGASVERLKKFCPRCGRGVFLAVHPDRLYCGRCGYTEYVTKQ